MNLRQLTIFKVVCEEMNFTRAAERLYMTQPAVSRAIAELEEESGIILFDRLSRRIYLTEAGRLFLEKTLHVLEAFEDLAAETQSAEHRAVLRIVSCITIAVTCLPDIIKELERRCRETEVRVKICSAANAVASLEANEADLVFMEGNFCREDWERTRFSSYRMEFFCSPEHEFADRRDIDADELVQSRLLLREKGSAIRDALDSALLLRHTAVEPAWTSTNSQAIIAAVKKNLGVSILPESLLEEALREQTLRPFYVKGLELTNDSYIVTHRDKHWTEPMKLLREIALSSGGDRSEAERGEAHFIGIPPS